jgi:hypothetical protein
VKMVVLHRILYRGGGVVSCRSQWPRGLKHELSSLARTLGSWVRIPLRAWMFGVCMRLFCVCVALCVGSGLATAYPSSKGPYRPRKMITKLNKRHDPEWDGRAIEKKHFLYPVMF